MSFNKTNLQIGLLLFAVSTSLIAAPKTEEISRDKITSQQKQKKVEPKEKVNELKEVKIEPEPLPKDKPKSYIYTAPKSRSTYCEYRPHRMGC